LDEKITEAPAKQGDKGKKYSEGMRHKFYKIRSTKVLHHSAWQNDEIRNNIEIQMKKTRNCSFGILEF